MAQDIKKGFHLKLNIRVETKDEAFQILESMVEDLKKEKSTRDNRHTAKIDNEYGYCKIKEFDYTKPVKPDLKVIDGDKK